MTLPATIETLIQRVRELDKAATPGPWKVAYRDCGGYDCMTHAYQVGPVRLDWADYGQQRCDYSSDPEATEPARQAKAEAEFLSFARTALPQLADALEAALRDAGGTPAGETILTTDFTSYGPSVCMDRDWMQDDSLPEWRHFSITDSHGNGGTFHGDDAEKIRDAMTELIARRGIDRKRTQRAPQEPT